MKSVDADNGRRKQRKVYLDTNLQIIFAVTLMAVLGVSTISPALPEIVRGFGNSEQAVGLHIAVFTLPGVLLTPIWVCSQTDSEEKNSAFAAALWYCQKCMFTSTRFQHPSGTSFLSGYRLQLL